MPLAAGSRLGPYEVVDLRGAGGTSSHGAEVRLWPMPDMSRPPFHALPLRELLARLDDLTNFRLVGDESSIPYRADTPGLGENPPSSREITNVVRAHCDQVTRAGGE